MSPPKLPAEVSASTLAWRKCPGVVYFLGAGEPKLVAIKIGMAAQTGERDICATLLRRLSQIQSSNHERIRLLGVKYFAKGVFEYPTWEAEKLEQQLHTEFRHFQRFKPYTRGAEWFEPADELVQRIRQLASPPETDWKLHPYVGSKLDVLGPNSSS